MRKVWYWSEERNEALRSAKVSRGLWKCEKCDFVGIRKEMAVDHIEPVVAVDSNDEDIWNSFIKRLFCGADGLQVICRECHSKKTKGESHARSEYRRSQKTKEAQ